jgi:hypothetical protein
VRATGARISPNLDIGLWLYRGGRAVESANPSSGRLSRDRASGLNATIRKRVGPGTYYVAGDGVGRGSATDSYDDYGSLGAYRLTVKGC